MSTSAPARACEACAVHPMAKYIDKCMYNNSRVHRVQPFPNCGETMRAHHAHAPEARVRKRVDTVDTTKGYVTPPTYFNKFC